ncbi:MAG: M28 family metallopeptidase [Flavobacteriaceae bacterium]
MKNIFFLALLAIGFGCKSTTQSPNGTQKSPTDYEQIINAESLKTHLYTIASDEMEGRMTGEKGQKMAADYIKNFYLKHNISSPLGKGNYFQVVPQNFFREGTVNADSENVIGFVEGSEKPEEVIIITAHYDHVGIKDGNIYNGADDDGSGTVAIMLLAQAFQKAKDDGNGPKRSVAFLHVTGEEIGLLGSRYYTDEDPIFPLANTVANLNIDMIGRIDPDKAANPNYIYLIGSDKLSRELHDVSEAMNTAYVNLELDYKYNAENDPNRFYYRSDHYNFAKNNVPVIFYFNGVHADYHKHTDTPDKIEYDLLETRSRLIFHTAWELANRKERVALDITE